MYLLPLVTLSNAVVPFLTAAALCAPLFAVWVVIDYRRVLRQQIAQARLNGRHGHAWRAPPDADEAMTFAPGGAWRSRLCAASSSTQGAFLYLREFPGAGDHGAIGGRRGGGHGVGEPQLSAGPQAGRQRQPSHHRPPGAVHRRPVSIPGADSTGWENSRANACSCRRPHDPHAYALYFYTRPGDHIGWHYDTSYYAGRRYTLLIGVIDDSTCRLDYQLHTREAGSGHGVGFVANSAGRFGVFRWR